MSRFWLALVLGLTVALGPCLAGETRLGALPERIVGNDGQALPVRLAGLEGSLVLVAEVNTATGWRRSDDGRHLAAVAVLPDGRQAAWVDGQLGPAGEAVRDLDFSPGAGVVSYAARRGGQWVVVVGDQESPPCLEPTLNHHLRIYSADGRQVATPVRTSAGWVMLCQARPVGKPYSALDEACPEFSTDGYRRVVGACRALFSPDGKRLAYVVHKGQRAAGGERVTVVVDGHEQPECAGVDQLCFSADGTRVGYAATRGEQQVVYLNGQAAGTADLVSDLTFSPEGKHYAYGALRGEQTRVVRDGQAGPAYETVSDLVFSPDGRRLAYVATRGERSCVVVDGQPGPWFAEIGLAWASSGLHPTFSADSRQLAYPVSEDEGYRLVVNGQVGPRYREIAVAYPIFTPAGHVYYQVTGADDRQAVVANGQAGPWYERVAALTVSPDGKRYAYVAGDGERECLVVDGQTVAAEGHFSALQFSADSQHLGYVATRGEQVSAVREGAAQAVPAPSVRNFRFSPDLGHWACLGTFADGSEALIADAGVAGRCAQGLTGSVSVTNSGRAEALGVRADGLYRLTGN